MSAAGNHPTHDDHGHADDHGHGDDLGSPPAPPPDEPQSPSWLPLLGGALFLGALLTFLVTRSPEADEPLPEEVPAEAAEAGEADGEAAPDGEGEAAGDADPHAGHNH